MNRAPMSSNPIAVGGITQQYSTSTILLDKRGKDPAPRSKQRSEVDSRPDAQEKK